MSRRCLALILAAGEGTRMQSSRPKVLHEIGGLPMIAHVARAAAASGAELAVVVGPGMDAVAAAARAEGVGDRVFVQAERRGTAHAVLQARALLAGAWDDVVVLFGDTPLVRPETIARIRAGLAGGADLVVLGFEADDPRGYGRLIEEGGDLVAIREERDASEAERTIRLCNSGIMAFAGSRVLDLVEPIRAENAKQEFYLTDAVAIARGQNCKIVVERGDPAEVLGVNDRAQLAAAEAAFQARTRQSALRNGATLVAPETVHFSADVTLGRDVVVEPNVIFGRHVVVEDGARIRAFSHLEGARIGRGAIVGPFARLRPGTVVGADGHVGNFVELKNTVLGAGAKANHLAYLGDADIGAGANVGAGTITCNYDGVLKHRTSIGAGTFIGSNATLVAPLTIGAGAYVAAGSVVTDDVPEDALAFGRARQAVKEEGGRRLRERLQAAKRGDSERS